MKTRESVEGKYGKEAGDIIVKYLAIIAARGKQVAALEEKLALHAKAGSKGRKRHKNDTKPFGGDDGLSFPEQAKSISAMTNNLKKSVNAHIRKAREEPGPKGEKRDPNVTRDKCLAQIERMLASLKRKYALTLIAAALLATCHHGFTQNGTDPGSVDLPFTGHTNVSYPVRQLVARPGGGLFVIQETYGGVPIFRTDQLFALNASFARDPAFQSFSPGGIGAINSVLPLSDGRLYVTGSSVLKRLLPNGTIDFGFVPNFSISGVSGIPGAAKQQPDGKILLGVSEAVFNGFTKTGIARFSNDGMLDTSFHYSGTGPSGPGGGVVGSIHILPDGKILISGSFTNVNGIARQGLARLNGDGTLDTSYTITLGGGTLGATILAAPGGKQVLIGSFTSVGGINVANIARLNPDGSVDTGFVSPFGPPGYTYRAAVLADGKLFVSGSFTNIGGLSKNGVARLNSDGSVDASFDTGIGIEPGANSYDANAIFYTAFEQPDGKILVGGSFSRINGVQHRYLARLNGDGGPVVSQSTNAGNITLSVAATGTGLTYQWQVNGTNLTGATGATFTVTNFAAANAGRYSVIVSNSAAVGVIVSQPAILRSFGDLRMFAGMSIAGESGDRYRIEAADIVPGVTNWVTVTTFTHPGGTFLYTDPNSPGRAQRYYRAVLEP